MVVRPGGQDEEAPLGDVKVGDRLRIRPGEKAPVGDWVTGATINGTRALVIEAERVGSETMLSQIVQKVAAAIVAFIAWASFGPPPAYAYGLVAAIAVHIIACPCALGLATPISIMMATVRGAQAGVLIRNAEALERFAKVDVLLVDKTGTLTEGKPKLVDGLPAEGFEAGRLSLSAMPCGCAACGCSAG